MEMTSLHLCCIVLARIKSKILLIHRGKGTTQTCDFQELGIMEGPPRIGSITVCLLDQNDSHLSHANYIHPFSRSLRVSSLYSICSKSKNLNIKSGQGIWIGPLGVVPLDLWWSEANLTLHHPCLLVFMPLCNTHSPPPPGMSRTCEMLLNNKIWQR